MDSGERGMNPVVITIINPWKKYWPSRRSNQRPPVLKPATLPTELWGFGSRNLEFCGEVKSKLYLLIDEILNWSKFRVFADDKFESV